MATPTLRAFHVGLYEEHLEDLSFLYEQRTALLRKPGAVWSELAPFEARAEAHLDALVVGDVTALETCRRRAAEGDFGELYAAVCVYCRQRQSALLAGILRDLDMADPMKVAAVADALAHELPEEWASFVGQALERRDAGVATVLSTVVAHRRLPFGLQLAQSAATMGPEPGAARIATALGRMREPAARPWLERMAAASGAQAAAVRDPATHALLRLGIAPPTLSPGGTAGPLHLALAGNADTARAFAVAAQEGRADADTLLALGLLGAPSTLRALYESLAQPELADAAALALHWISGAPLFEDQFVPEEVNEAELLPQELQAWRQYREAPKRPDGQAYGEAVRKLTTEQAHWKQWFTDNASRFDAALRYRGGRPCSPQLLVDSLRDPEADSRLRRAAADELAVRYGCDLPFETDMRVLDQHRALHALTAWASGPGAAFEPGRWYFAGQPC